MFKACLGSLFLFACSSGAGNNAPPIDNGGQGGAAATSSTTTGSGGSQPDPLDFPSDDDFDENSTGDDLLDPTITAPTQIVPGEGTLVAITGDDRLVYTTADGLWSIKAAIGAPPRKAASIAGDVHVKGRTIFNFANVDYGTYQGDLTFWTPSIGRRSVGKAMIGADRVASRRDDAYVMFVKNVELDTVDIVIVSADKTHAQLLVDDAGRGGEDTCAPTFGFAGDAAVVSWCTLGSMEATLARFTVGAEGNWERTDISTSAQGFWTSDALGLRLFYVTMSGQARVTDMVNDQSLAEGAGWGMLNPAGNVVFFTVGDQLRKSDMVGSPIPIVVDSFAASVAWPADFAMVLYSSEVVYQDGTKQDLRSSTTDWFNPSPSTLESQPIATIGRSALTTEGDHAIYFTNVDTEGAGTLHVRPLSGAAGVTFPNVETAVSAALSRIVFTDNHTAPSVYPALVDMKMMDAKSTTAPHMLEAAIGDADIQIRSDKNTVAYRREGDAPASGIWLRPIQ